MRIIKQFKGTIMSTGILILQAALFIICFHPLWDGDGIKGDDAVFLVIQTFFLVISVGVCHRNLFNEIKNCKEKNIMRTKKSNLVKRQQITNMLRQFNDDLEVNCSKSDIDFIKSMLLHIKAKLIQGLQNYDVPNDVKYDEYQYKYSDSCIQSIRNNDLKWALKWFTEIYDCNFPFHTYCNYSELIVSTLLISNIIGLCDSLLSKMDKPALTASSGKNLIQDVMSGIRRLSDLDSEIESWHSCFPELSFKTYFGLTDDESTYVGKCVFEAFRAIVACRKNGLSMKAYMEKIQEEISCFFSALGTPCRTHDEFFEEKRGNIL